MTIILMESLDMKFIYLLLILTSIIFIPNTQVSALEGNVYEETIESYARIDGETFRFEMKRTFIIKDFEYTQRVVNDVTENIVIADILYDTQRGQIEKVIQPLKGVNFELTALFNDDNTPLEYSWEILLFRDVNDPRILSNPEDNNIRSTFSRIEHEQFDLKSSTTFFSVNLQHFEYQEINGEEVKIKVNTDLSTKNYENGRLEKSAIHMIKRNGADILFDYNREIQEKSVFQRYLNLLDQPDLLVPAQFVAVFVILTIYVYSHRYWTSRGIKIIKTYGKTVELHDNEESEIDSKDVKSKNTASKDEESE